MSDVITLHVDEPQPITLDYIEAKIKPETVGHATPTEQAQTVTPAPGTTFSAVDVDAIPPEYVVPSGTLDITENANNINVRDKVAVNVNVQPKLETPDPITPTEQQQTITPGTGYDGLAQAVVEPIPSEYIVPAGKITLTENATDVNVSQYESADIAVPVPQMPEEYPIGGSICDGTAESYHISENVTEIKDYTFYKLGIKNIELPEGLHTIGTNAFAHTELLSFEFPSTVETIKTYVFNGCNYLRTMIFNQSNIDATANHCLYTTALRTMIFAENVESFTFATGYLQALPNTITLFDFSRCKNIVAISSYDLPHANGCVVRVPSALLSDWQNETNWNAITNIVWEGV